VTAPSDAAQYRIPTAYPTATKSTATSTGIAFGSFLISSKGWRMKKNEIPIQT
jgi:hypothetical protein